MRELIKAVLRFSWATSLFGVRQLAAGLTDGLGNVPAGPAPAFQKVAGAAAATLEGFLSDLHDSGARLQSRVVDAVLPSGSGGGSATPSNGGAQTSIEKPLE